LFSTAVQDLPQLGNPLAFAVDHQFHFGDTLLGQEYLILFVKCLDQSLV